MLQTPSIDYRYGNHGHSTFYPKELEKKGAIYRNAELDTQPEVLAEGVRNFLELRKEFIESCSGPLPVRPEGRPFCLCVTFNLPHGAGTTTMQLRPAADELRGADRRAGLGSARRGGAAAHR